MVRRRKLRQLEPFVTPWAQFHAYVLGSVIGIRWGIITPTSGMGNEDLYGIVREYLTYSCGGDEWKKYAVLSAMRGKSAASIKDDARYAFPSLFPRHRRAHSLCVPEEVKEEAAFDIDKINDWVERVKAIKKEITMSENEVAEQETAEATGTSTTARSASNGRVTVNFYIPEGTSPEDLTLENYREITQKRYRMTKDQMTRGLSREDAFAESKALAMSQLGAR